MDDWKKIKEEAETLRNLELQTRELRRIMSENDQRWSRLDHAEEMCREIEKDMDYKWIIAEMERDAERAKLQETHQEMRSDMQEIREWCREIQEESKRRNDDTTTRLAALETSMQRALHSMFPLVETLLSRLDKTTTANNGPSNTIVAAIHSAASSTHTPREATGARPQTANHVVTSSVIANTSSISGTSTRFLEVKERVCSAAATSAAASSSSTAVAPASDTIASAYVNIASASSFLSHVSSPSNLATTAAAKAPNNIALSMTSIASTTSSTSSVPGSSSSTIPRSQHSWKSAPTLEESLRHATYQGNADEVRRLLAEGANVNASDVTRRRAIHIAAERGHDEIVHVFIQGGAYVDCREVTDWTPLHTAASNGHAGVVSLLLRYGASVDSRKRNRWTPLFCAVHAGHEDCVRILLKAGADPSAKDRWGKTPKHIAPTNAIKQLLWQAPD